MPRFVIQRHEREVDPHFDIMLERGEALRTWSSSRAPEEGDGEVKALPEHRLHYLTYEGEISGGRGRVRIWDRGTYADRVWEEGRIVVDLTGERSVGRLSLTLIEDDRWQMHFQPPEIAEAYSLPEK